MKVVDSKTGNIVELDLDALNDVNADIRFTDRKIDENLELNRRLRAERANLRQRLIDLKQQRRKLIFGQFENR
jgi:regulator of replication initiation timing